MTRPPARKELQRPKARKPDQRVALEVPMTSIYEGKLKLVQHGLLDAARYVGKHKQKNLEFIGLAGLQRARQFATQNGYTGIVIESGSLVASWEPNR